MKSASDAKPKFIGLRRVLKWGTLIAKLAALGTTISGAIAAFSGSVSAGMALGAAGATTYAAAKGLPSKGYEKTRHIPPGPVRQSINLRGKTNFEASGKMKAGQTVPGIHQSFRARPTHSVSNHALLNRKK